MELIAAAIARDDNIQPNVPRDETRDDVMSIKCCLKTLVCLSGDEKEEFFKHLSEIVAVMSKLRVRAFQTVTLFLMQTLKDPEQYPDAFFGSLVHGKPLAGITVPALRRAGSATSTA